MERLAQEALQLEREASEEFALANEFLMGAFLGTGPRADPARVSLLEAIDAASERIEAEPSLADRGDVRADLHVAFAFWYLSLDGRLDRADVHATEALRLYEAADSTDEGYLAWAHETVGLVALQRGRFAEARASLRRAHELYRSAGSGELNDARVAAALVHCFLELGDPEGALEFAEESHAVARRRLGDEDPQTESLLATLEHVRSLVD